MGQSYIIRRNPKAISMLSGAPSNFKKCIHVGCLEFENESSVFQKKAVDFFENMDSLPIFIPSETYSGRESYCANNIRSLFHHIIWTRSISYSKDYENWNCYHQLNKAYLDPIVSICSEKDEVWIHDYQLLLLPEMLSTRVINTNIGFYLHCVFPSTEILRCIPKRKEL